MNKYVRLIFITIFFCIFQISAKEAPIPEIILESMRENIKLPSVEFNEKYLKKVISILSDETNLRSILSNKQLNELRKKLPLLQWRINTSEGFYCASSHERCFAINIKYSQGIISVFSDPIHLIILNRNYIKNVQNDSLIQIGLIHEALGALLGSIDTNYQISILIWYLNYLESINEIVRKNELISLYTETKKNSSKGSILKYFDLLHSVAGGTSNVGGGDLSAIEFKKQLLTNSIEYFEKRSTCYSLAEFQYFLLNTRVELNPEDFGSLDKAIRVGEPIVIRDPYWSKNDKIIYISRFSGIANKGITNYFSRYTWSILDELEKERDCHHETNN